MKRCSLLLAAGLLLAGLPAQAAVKSEAIPLTYLSAAELEDLLSPMPRSDFPQNRKMRGTVGPGVIPRGITAWAVDPRKNALSVSGEADAVEEFKRLIRILDVPARRLRVSVRLVQLDAAGAEPLRKNPNAQESNGLKLLLLSKEEKARLDAQPAVLAAEVNTSNNHRVYLRRPGAAGQPERPLALFPSVNGDNTITLATLGLLPTDMPPGSYFSLQRVPSGTPILALDGENRAWVFATELLPD